MGVGYVMLSELEKLEIKPFGGKIERDRYVCKGAKIKELI